MKGKDFLKSFKAEACNTVVYILNRSYTKAVNEMTPLHAFFGKKPSAAHFRIFGCECFVHVSDANKTKWDLKTKMKSSEYSQNTSFIRHMKVASALIKPKPSSVNS